MVHRNMQCLFVRWSLDQKWYYLLGITSPAFVRLTIGLSNLSITISHLCSSRRLESHNAIMPAAPSQPPVKLSLPLVI